MKFVIDGSGENIQGDLVAKRMLKVLDNLKDGDLLTSRTFALKAGFRSKYFNQYSGLKVFDKYKLRHGMGNVWGNPKTIKEFKKEIGKQKL